MKKLTALFTALLMTLLVGCGEGGKAAKLVAVEEDAKSFNYSVVRPKGCSEDIEAAAKEIRSKLRKTYGVSVTVSYGEEKDYDGNYEILIGNTGRAESEEALKRLKENRENCQFDFIIKTVGEKLCITALRDEMTARAAEYFAETYCADKSGWEKLNSQTELIYEAPFKAHPHKIGGTELRNFTVVTVRDMEYIYGREIENTVNYLSGSQGYELAVTDERSPEVKNEILIGELDRAASKKVSAESGGWIIKATDSKLVIKGADSLCLADAVSHFLQMLKEKENADSYIELPADYELKGKPESSGGYSLVWNDEFDQKSLNNHWWVDYSSQNTYGATSNSCLGGTVTQKAAENTKMTGDGCLTIFSTPPARTKPPCSSPCRTRPVPFPRCWTCWPEMTSTCASWNPAPCAASAGNTSFSLMWRAIWKTRATPPCWNGCATPAPASASWAAIPPARSWTA